MIKKKRFGISEELSRGFSETINVVENNDGTFRHSVIPFSRLELDPENPRNLLININEVKNGIDPKDALKTEKEIELERIRELSNTIKSAGLINPIVVYKRGDIYRVVAGERRCLASILLGRTEIEAKVYNEKPNAFDLKLIQWIENTAREDLSLFDRIGNIRDIQVEFAKKNNKDILANELSQLTGISSSQAACYLTVLKGHKEALDLIKDGKLNNLDKAALIANAESNELRQELIKECVGGANLKELRQRVAVVRDKKNKAGRKRTRINMGFVNSPKVIKIISESLIGNTALKIAFPDIAKIDWKDHKSTSEFFKKLLNCLEKSIEA